MKKEVGASNWGNITVYAYNTTGDGNLSVANVTQDTQAPVRTGMNLASVIAILVAIPILILTIPNILVALALVAMYAAVIALILGVVFHLVGLLSKTLSLGKGK